jgi:hypothetical protein
MLDAPEDGWGELVREAVDAGAWVDADRDPSTFDLRGEIPILAAKLADHEPLHPTEAALLDRLRADPETAALLDETTEALRVLGAPVTERSAAANPSATTTARTPAAHVAQLGFAERSAAASARRASWISVAQLGFAERSAAASARRASWISDEEESMNWNALPEPPTVVPLRRGHSTLTVVATATAAAAAAILLFSWLGRSTATAPEPTSTVVVAVPLPVETAEAPAVAASPPAAPTPIPGEATEFSSEVEELVDTDGEPARADVERVVRRPKADRSKHDNAAYAVELLQEARTLQFKEPSRAHALASVSYRLKPSQSAAAVMAFCACRMKDAPKAKTAVALLRGERRETLVKACWRQGITVQD